MENILITPVTFGKVIDVFLKTKAKYYYICNHDRVLLGVISQSDILYSLIFKEHQKDVFSLMNPNFIFWDIDTQKLPPIQKCCEEKVSEFPILDSKRRLLKIYSLFDSVL